MQTVAAAGNAVFVVPKALSFKPSSPRFYDLLVTLFLKYGKIIRSATPSNRLSGSVPTSSPRATFLLSPPLPSSGTASIKLQWQTKPNSQALTPFKSTFPTLIPATAALQLPSMTLSIGLSASFNFSAFLVTVS